MRIGKKGQRTTHENTIDDDTSSPLVGARAFSSSFIVSTTTMPLLFAVLFVGCLVFAPPLFLRVLGKFAVLYLCLKMMSMTICAKREASKSSSLLLLLLLLSRKSRVSFEGKTRVVVVSPQKSRSSFRDFGGRVLHRFCGEVFTLDVLLTKKNVSKMCQKCLEFFVPLFS